MKEDGRHQLCMAPSLSGGILPAAFSTGAHLEVLRLHHAQLCAGCCELPPRVEDLPLQVCLPLHRGLRSHRAWAEALGDLAAGCACAAGGGVCAWRPPVPLKVLCQHPNRRFQSAGTAEGRETLSGKPSWGEGYL